MNGVKEVNSNKEKEIEVIPSSGNVFADLGISDSEELNAKAIIASRICSIISERKLCQKKAAAVLGIDQPKISALMHGKLDGFSSDRLFRFPNSLGRDVEIIIRPKSSNAENGIVRVIEK